MNGYEGSWLEEWVEDFLAKTPPGWPFEDGLELKIDSAA
jgi:hypothetical protein